MKPPQNWRRSKAVEKFTFYVGFRQTGELPLSPFQHPVGWAAPRGRIDRTASEVSGIVRSLAGAQLRTGGPPDGTLLEPELPTRDPLPLRVRQVRRVGLLVHER